MEHEDRVYHPGADGTFDAGNGTPKCKGHFDLYGDGLAPQRRLGPPLARPAPEWEDLGRIELRPGWAADWLSDDDPRRFFRLDGVQDGEAPGGGDNGEAQPGVEQAVDDLGALPVGFPGEGLAQTEDAPGRLERPQAGEPDDAD